VRLNDHVDDRNESSSEFQPRDMHGDFLQIIIGGEVVLVKSAEIKEVSRPFPLTAVPMGPDHLLGLANIRGQIICVIDLSKISALPSINRNITTRSRLVVLRHPRMNVGIWADEVRLTQHLNSEEVTLPEDVQQASGSVIRINCQNQKQYMLNCKKLFH
jgi:chemotaxis signal transduction protein